MERSAAAPQSEARQTESADGGSGAPADFVSCSTAMEAVWRVVDRVAPTDVPVLIRGESGVGKDVVARALHARSVRSGRPFLKINCAALPANLLESELFGYQRGAFTGAQNDTKGKFELADDGTLFLDEIGEMPPEMQAKLLQVLQDGEYFRVGGSRAVKVNTRVVVATNRDLESEIARGGFRADLYYRLNVVSVRVPPLRDRPEDVELLLEHFVRKYSRRYDTGAGDIPDDVRELFRRHSWPGNVRELENLVRRIVVMGDARCIVPDLLGAPALAPVEGAPLPVPLPAASQSAAEIFERMGILPAGAGDEIALKDVAHKARIAAEREAIAHVLRRCAWNKRRAAVRLRISYKALLYKIKECGILDPRVEHSL